MGCPLREARTIRLASLASAMKPPVSTSTSRLPPRAADDRDLRHARHLFDLGLQLRGNTAQRVMIKAIARQRQSQNRNIVDRPRLDQRRRGTRRNLVGVRVELVVQSDDR